MWNPKPYAPGDLIESPMLPRRFGIVNEVYETTRNFLRVLEFGTGELICIAIDDVKRVHGYLHIDRPTREHF